MVDLKKINGVMDTDSPNENIGQFTIKKAVNTTTIGDKGDLQIQNRVGNTLIPNNLPAGINECIGAFYDDLRKQIIYCNYNSNSNHQIYIIATDTLAITPLVISGTNTDGDILGFTLDGKIYNMRILYGDSEQGDTIYFNNSQDELCQINIKRTLAGTYGVLKRDFLEVIKFPANRPPYVTYGNDATVTVNTLRKKLFKFKTRPVYFSREKSVTSMQSEIPLPINADSITVDQDPTKNCKISIVYETLGADVEKIEILGSVIGKSDETGVIDPNQFSDFFLIETIVKADLGLFDNDIATYVFRNDKAYIEIDPEDSIQLQDLVPLNAGALDILKGKVPIYGAITEGFDLINVTATAVVSAIHEKQTQLPFICVASQSGDSAFGNDYVSGGISADGVIHVVSLGTINIFDGFTITTTNHSLVGNSMATLAASAATAGFTIITPVGANDLYIAKAGEILQMVQCSQFSINGEVITNNFAYNYNDKLAFCVNYFDKGGRTAGAQTTSGLSVQTVNYTEGVVKPNIPQILLSITNRPPIDADYFTLGRTDSLAKLKFIYWVSASTYQDTESAYIGIGNLNTYIDENKPGANHLAYDYAPGDRIRFIKNMKGASAGTVYVNNDFPLTGQLLSQPINGATRLGQFLKIKLPTTSSSFNFGDDFNNYLIELYTPTRPVATGLDNFNEFGERYTIGNPGTSTRYHQGMTQNQTANLSQPATFTLTQGEAYYRYRKINLGAEYRYKTQNYTENSSTTFARVIHCDFVSQSFAEASITAASYPGALLTIGATFATPFLFKIKGTIKLKFNFYNSGSDFNIFLTTGPTPLVNTFLIQNQTIVPVATVYNIEGLFSINTLQNLTLNLTSSSYYIQVEIISTEFTITRQDLISAPVMDANYSDIFPSKANSNGRLTIEQPDSVKGYYPARLRLGKENNINTSINEVSRFTVLNSDELDLSKGDISVLSSDGSVLDIVQTNGCGWLGINTRVLKQDDGSDVLLSTNDIITKGNIQYLHGKYGIGNQKGSFAKGKIGYYFTDPDIGSNIRRSQNGLINLNEVHKGQYVIRPILSNYNNDYVKQNGSLSKLISYYDTYFEQYVTVCPEGTFNGKSIPNTTFAFSEKDNAFGNFLELYPEWILCDQDKTFAWKNGNCYIHNNTTKYGEFFGVQTYPSVTFVFNDKEQLKKIYDRIGYQSNQIWESKNVGDIKTSMVDPDTGLRQESLLIKQDYTKEDNLLYADFLRDLNSLLDKDEALLEGGFLNGNWIEVTLTYYGSDFAFLYSPYVVYQINNRNF